MRSRYKVNPPTCAVTLCWIAGAIKKPRHKRGFCWSPNITGLKPEPDHPLRCACQAFPAWLAPLFPPFSSILRLFLFLSAPVRHAPTSRVARIHSTWQDSFPYGISALPRRTSASSKHATPGARAIQGSPIMRQRGRNVHSLSQLGRKAWPPARGCASHRR